MTSTGETSGWELIVQFHRFAKLQMDTSLKDQTSWSLAEYDVLRQLSLVYEPVNVELLGQLLLVESSLLNATVANLVDQGLLNIEQGESQVTTFLSLTETGKKAHRLMAVIHGRDINRLFCTQVSETERDVLCNVFERLLANSQVTPS